MHLSIYSSNLPFPITLFDIILKKGHILRMSESDNIFRGTVYELWFKANVLDTLIINCDYKIIEWTINNDDDVINTVEGSISASKQPELLDFFDQLNNILKIIKNEKLTNNTFNQLINILQTYVLKIILFRPKHINLLDKVFQKQVNAIQQIEKDILVRKMIFWKSRNETKNWLLNFVKDDKFNAYPQRFLETLSENADNIIHNIADELEQNQEELENSNELGYSKQSNLFSEAREKLIYDLKHWLTIRIKGWNAYKKGKKNKREKNYNFDVNITSYKRLWDNMIKNRLLFNQSEKSLNTALGIKDTIYCFCLELKQMVESKERSLQIYNNSFLDEKDLGFNETLYDDIGSVISNKCSPTRKITREFIALFKQNCLMIEKDKTIWYINEERVINSKVGSNSISHFILNNNENKLRSNKKGLAMNQYLQTDDFFDTILDSFSESQESIVFEDLELESENNVSSINEKKNQESKCSRKISLGEFYQFEKIDAEINPIMDREDINFLPDTNKNNLMCSKYQIIENDFQITLKDEIHWQKKFSDLNNESSSGVTKKHEILLHKKGTEENGNDIENDQENIQVEGRNEMHSTKTNDKEVKNNQISISEENSILIANTQKIQNPIKSIKVTNKMRIDGENDDSVSSDHNYINKNPTNDEKSNFTQNNQESKKYTILNVSAMTLESISANINPEGKTDDEDNTNSELDELTQDAVQFNNVLLLEDLEDLLRSHIDQIYSELKKYDYSSLNDTSLYTFWAYYEPQIYPAIYENIISLYSTIFEDISLKLHIYMRKSLSQEKARIQFSSILNDYCTHNHNHTMSSISDTDDIFCTSFQTYFIPTYKQLESVINCQSLLHSSLLLTKAFHILHQQIAQKKTVIGADIFLPTLELLLLHLPPNRNIALFVIIKILNDFMIHFPFEIHQYSLSSFIGVYELYLQCIGIKDFFINSGNQKK